MGNNIKDRNAAILEEISYDIGNFCAKWGRISVTQTKEKYNTVRVYCHFGICGLHSLIFPKYIYKHPKYPKWLWGLDFTVFFPLFEKLNFIIIPYQKFIYKVAYWKQIYKHPHLFEEITSCADFQELLGFEILNLCIDHGENYNKTHYLSDKEKCIMCQETNT